MYVTTRMQKTKDIVHNPISEEALELIGYSPDKRGKVFPDFKDSMTQAPLKQLLIIPGASHCDLYDGGGKGMIPWDNIEEFLKKNI